MNKEEMEARIEDELLMLGVPAHIKGFAYLRTAVALVIEDENAIRRMVDVVYPGVAETHGTSSTNAERCIRHAIETALLNCGWEFVDSYFGNSISKRSGKLTNAAFIAVVAMRLRRKLRVREGAEAV